MKKILVGLTALAVMALAAGPALANGWQYSVGNGAIVINNVGAASYTGGNGIANSENEDMNVGGNISSNNDGNTIKTGNAESNVKSYVVVNSNVALDGCCGPKEQVVVENFAYLDNSVIAISDTGGNGIANSENSYGWFGGNISSNNDGNTIKTGNANSNVNSYVAVNSNVALDGCCGPKEQYVGEWNWAEVDNEVMAIAATGGNGIANSENDDMGVGGNISSNNDRNTINTGNAESNVYSIVVINSNISRILR